MVQSQMTSQTSLRKTISSAISRCRVDAGFMPRSERFLLEDGKYGSLMEKECSEVWDSVPINWTVYMLGEFQDSRMKVLRLPRSPVRGNIEGSWIS